MQVLFIVGKAEGVIIFNGHTKLWVTKDEQERRREVLFILEQEVGRKRARCTLLNGGLPVEFHAKGGEEAHGSDHG